MKKRMEAIKFLTDFIPILQFYRDQSQNKTLKSIRNDKISHK